MIARMMQLQFDREHNAMLDREATKYNGTSKGWFVFWNLSFFSFLSFSLSLSQLQFDREHNAMLDREAMKYNGTSKGQFVFWDSSLSLLHSFFPVSVFWIDYHFTFEFWVHFSTPFLFVQGMEFSRISTDNLALPQCKHLITTVQLATPPLPHPDVLFIKVYAHLYVYMQYVMCGHTQDNEDFLLKFKSYPSLVHWFSVWLTSAKQYGPTKM